MAAPRWRQTLETLVKDTRLDADGYVLRTASLLGDVIADSVPTTREEYAAWLVQRGRRFIGAGRERAAIFRLVNDVLWATDEASSAEVMRIRALAHIESYGARRAEVAEKLAANASEYLSRYRTIMAYGRKPALLQALSLAAGRDRAPMVVLGEGRPRFDGLTLASELAWAGVRVTLGVDMALFGWLPEVEALVLGAESLSPRGLLYRRGAAALAEAAMLREVPVYVLCAQDDFAPAEYPAACDPGAGDPGDITPEAHERITVRNPSWDLTPLEQLAGVITDDGMLAGEALLQALSRPLVHPALLGR